jgi:hypothetical protein
LFKTSGFLVNYGSKAHDIGGLDRKIVTGRLQAHGGLSIDDFGAGAADAVA